MHIYTFLINYSFCLDFSEEEKEVPVQKKPPTKEKFSEQRDVEDDMLVEVC